MWCLAIDLGATFIKGAAVNTLTGEVAHVVRRPFPGFAAGLPPGWREVPVRRITDEAGRLLQELADRAPQAEAVFWCGQMHGFVLCDRQGSPMGDFVSWQDQRSLRADGEGGGILWSDLQALVSPAERAELGEEFSPRHPVATLYWLARRRQLPRGAYVASLTDFIVAHLCNSRPSTHPTNASAHGLYRLATGTWHDELIERLGLDLLSWPEVVPEQQPVGETTVNGRRLRCHVPIGDQQAALCGAGIQPDELSLNIATGSQVSRVVDYIETGPYQTRPYVNGRYLRTITHLPAGRALNAWLALLEELPAAQGSPLLKPWDLVNQAVGNVPATDLVADLALFNCAVGESGGLARVHEENLKVGHLFLAAFVSMARNYETAARRIAPDKQWSRIVFSGGLAQKLPRLRNCIMERLGENYRIAPEAEDTLAGLRNFAGSILHA